MKVGELVADRYELEELVGEGGMSSVFRARDTVLERQVALKVLHEHHGRDPEYVERFRREARAIARLAHPNIVTVIDRDEWRGRQFIVFEHVLGETLKDVVDREAPLPVERTLALAHQIGRALAFAHEAGIVHRDVKPENVLIDADGVAKVTDFGIARSLDPDDELTQTGTLLGTGDYLSPEQASGERVDEASDQYSLGIVLYELLTGEVPYPAPNVMAAAVRHLRDPLPSVRERRPEVSPRVDAIVGRSLAKRPRDRFPSMESMTAALEASLAEERATSRGAAGEDTGVIPAPLAVERPARSPRSTLRARPAVVALLVLAVGALVAGLLAAQLGRDDGGGAGNGAAGDGDESNGEAAVQLRAVSDYDPEGDDSEHPEDVELATDGDPATYWRTETYSSFTKPGVGIVLAAPEPAALSRLVVVSSEPGFQAKIQAGPNEDGPFEDVSGEQTVEERTAFELDTGEEEYGFYVIWITDVAGRATVNEVRARA